MRIVPFLVVFALIMAQSAHAENIPLGQPFTLDVDESALVGDLPLSVHFNSVLMDSRCPSDVVCFWEGEAAASVQLTTPGGDIASVVLHTPLSPLGDAHAEFAGHLVSLRRVSPYPSIQEPIDPLDYRVELVVQHASGIPAHPESWSMLKARFQP